MQNLGAEKEIHGKQINDQIDSPASPVHGIVLCTGDPVLFLHWSFADIQLA